MTNTTGIYYAHHTTKMLITRSFHTLQRSRVFWGVGAGLIGVPTSFNRDLVHERSVSSTSARDSQQKTGNSKRIHTTPRKATLKR